MRRILILGMLLLAGCQHVSGPFAPRSNARADDPRLSIAEQQSRVRDRYALPDASPGVGPPSGAGLPR
ncbi:MAG: hypothetical protein HY289_12160 [Planctomycetes bacterium]|nr:hypothetical protein [Planctomycetota bacterium]